MEVSNEIRATLLSFQAQRAEGNLELEARFRDVRRSPLSASTFQRVKNLFVRSEHHHVSSTDYIQGDIRQTVIPNQPDQWMEKTRLWFLDDKQYPVSYKISLERAIDPPDVFNPTLIRSKHRDSYYLGAVQIDLTHIHSQIDGKTTYEIEAELLDHDRLDTLSQAIDLLLTVILDTRILFTESQQQTVTNSFNQILGLDRPRSTELNRFALTQARNLKKRDLVSGGIVSEKASTVLYSVAHKADGERRALIIVVNQVWLVLPTDRYTYVKDISTNEFHGTILDVELIPKEKRLPGAPNTNYWCLAFDTLAYRGDYRIQKASYTERIKFAHEVAQIISDDEVITISAKAKRGLTRTNFFDVMNEMFEEQSHLTFHQDGFVFTPETQPYHPFTGRPPPLPKRILTIHPDICKWKPVDKLTIDFRVRNGELYVGSSEGEVRFTDLSPSPPLTVDKLNMSGLPDNLVVEFGWATDHQWLTPTRVRYDKTKPNNADIALDVWRDIHDPLSEELLRGRTFRLAHAYHNRIKRQLLEQYQGTLLDLGSGRGEDVAKWKKYHHVVCVEPNETHRMELGRRIAGMGWRCTCDPADKEARVLILPTGAESTELITDACRRFLGGQAMVVASMLSLSFFWSAGRRLLPAVLNTIRQNLSPEGVFVFLTIDGDALEQMFRPSLPLLNPFASLDKLELENYRIDWLGKSEVRFTMPGTIVGEQVEGLVRLGDLREVLNFKNISRADQELFLSNNERTFSRLYSYGVAHLKT